MSRGPDAGTLLTRALLVSAADAGCAAALVHADWTRWASATFVGARHSIAMRAGRSPHLDTWLAALPEATFSLRGHLLADIVVVQVHRHADWVEFSLEALTVEAR